MKKEIIVKGLAVVVILLFVGIGIQPAFAFTPTIDTNDTCDLCPKKGKSHLLSIESILNRLEIFEKQLSILYKLNLEVEDKYKKISERIFVLKEIYNKQITITNNDEFPFICFIINLMSIPTFEIYWFYQEMHDIFDSIWLPFEILFSFFFYFVTIYGTVYDCWR